MVMIENYEGLVAHIAHEFSRKYYMVDSSDIRQQLWLWFFEHPNKVKLWESYDAKETTKIIARSLRNAAKDYCQKEKARFSGYNIDDVYYYDRQIIELILPTVLRGDAIPPQWQDLDLFVFKKKVLSEGGNLMAMAADVDRALRKLKPEQLSIIYLRFGDGCDNTTLARELSVSEDAARMRVNRAMNNLMNILGGSKPHRERDLTNDEVEKLAAKNSENGDDFPNTNFPDEALGEEVEDDLPEL